MLIRKNKPMPSIGTRCHESWQRWRGMEMASRQWFVISLRFPRDWDGTWNVCVSQDVQTSTPTLLDPMRFFAHELAATSKLKDDKWIPTGLHTQENIQSCIFDFIKRFVLCKACMLCFFVALKVNEWSKSSPTRQGLVFFFWNETRENLQKKCFKCIFSYNKLIKANKKADMKETTSAIAPKHRIDVLNSVSLKFHQEHFVNAV